MRRKNMRESRVILIAATLMLTMIVPRVATSGPQDVGSSGTRNSATISYSFQDHQITLHEPVIVMLKITNGSTQIIDVDLGQDRKGGFSFAVTGPDGVEHQLPVVLREGFSISGRLSIQPSETFIENLLLNERYNFSVPGEYTIRGRLEKPIIGKNGQLSQQDTGFRETIRIAQRDELKLNGWCAALATKVESASSYQDAADAALILSYIKDPVAVPYLRRALFSHKLVEPIAITGLERIANEAAVQVLTEALRGESHDTSTLARASLAHIQKQTVDPAIKQLIDRALAPAST
jgi:hypothetical protein